MLPLHLATLVLLPFLTAPARSDGGYCPEGKGRTIPVSPGSSIQRALDAAAPGDTVLVKAGTYRGEINLNRGGSPGACVTLRGEPGAVISGGRWGILIRGQSWFSIQGLTVANIQGGDTPIGISVKGSASHFEIRNNLVHHVLSSSDAHGIAFYGNDKEPMSDFLVDGNEIRDCKLGQSESMVLNGNVAKFVVSNNKVHDNDNIGIDFIGFEGNGPKGLDQARNGRCVGNTVYNISSANNSTYHGERSADGIYVDGGRDIVIEGNNVKNADVGIEVASEHGGRATTGITVRGNTVSGSFQGDVMMGGYDAGRGSASAIVVDGNTLSGANDGEVILQYNVNGVTISNNNLSGRKGIIPTGYNNRNVQLKDNHYNGIAGGKAAGVWNDAGGILLQVFDNR